MATLAELDANGELHKLDAELPYGRQTERLIYVSPRLRDWLINSLPHLEGEWGTEDAPDMQVAALIEDFCAGAELAVGLRFHVMRPAYNGVWELKTPDVRIFGWFVHRDCFVGYVGDSASRVKRHNLYPGYREETVRFRNALALDPPKFIPDEDPHAVVSAYHYP